MNKGTHEARAFASRFRHLPDRAEGVDIVVQDEEPRWKRLLVADMDSTIIGQECIDELADFAGLKSEIAAITERAMQGELDFEAALRERVALLAGLPEDAITRCLAERVRPNPGAITLVRTMGALGAQSLLVSGGFHAFADPVARDQLRGLVFLFQDMERAGEINTGEIGGPLLRVVFVEIIAQI